MIEKTLIKQNEKNRISNNAAKQLNKDKGVNSCNSCGVCNRLRSPHSSSEGALLALSQAKAIGKESCAASFMQKNYGNGFTAKLLSRPSAVGGQPTIQKKCSCGGSCQNCKGEEEAEKISMSIMKMESGQQSVAGGRRTADSGEHVQISEIMSSKGSGHGLDDNTRSFMGKRFGYDFSHVRLHNDSYAARKSNELNAEAFTIGRDVFFNQGRYSPSSTQGKQLLAHELTHVVQQDLHNYTSITRWSISGNTATSDNDKDTLWNLAKSITGNGRDWACIWPIEMKSPKAWEDNYERYIWIGDKFDISNLKLTTGPSAIFIFQLADDSLQSLQALYGGTNPVDGYSDIGELANYGKTPIQNLTLGGHTAGNSIWGDTATFTPSDYASEEPTPTGAGAWNEIGPHRCWFTRNATVRIVGCTSQTVARAFARTFLRKGGSARGTNHWICWWHQTDPTDSRFASVEGPPCNWPPSAPRSHSAAAVNSAAGLWVTINGRL